MYGFVEMVAACPFSLSLLKWGVFFISFPFSFFTAWFFVEWVRLLVGTDYAAGQEASMDGWMDG